MRMAFSQKRGPWRSWIVAEPRLLIDRNKRRYEVSDVSVRPDINDKAVSCPNISIRPLDDWKFGQDPRQRGAGELGDY